MTIGQAKLPDVFLLAFIVLVAGDGKLCIGVPAEHLALDAGLCRRSHGKADEKG